MPDANATKLSKLYLIDPLTGAQFHMLVAALNVSAGTKGGNYVVKIGGYLHESNAKRLMRVLGQDVENPLHRRNGQDSVPYTAEVTGSHV